MTNRDLAQLRDPERRMPGWWRDEVDVESRTIYPAEIPDWHADDLACFRDWRPVLLAAGCYITEEDVYGCTVYWRKGQGCISDSVCIQTYRAAILAAVAWLAEHKADALRKAIARMEGGK